MSYQVSDFRKAWFDFDRFLNYCNCPATDSFAGWKGAVVFHDCHYDGGVVQPEYWEYCIVKLKIPADSPRLRANSSKKCRCKYAKVLDIQRRDGSSYPYGTVAFSIYEARDHHFCDPASYKTRYKKGKKVYADYFDDDRENECSHGIHFFMSREDAAAYINS